MNKHDLIFLNNTPKAPFFSSSSLGIPNVIFEILCGLFIQLVVLFFIDL